MKLIAGLGNPGPKYVNTRHNIGFMTLIKLHAELQFPDFKVEQKFNAATSEGIINDEKLILALPLTYMNNSGLAINKIVQYFKIDPTDCIIICDDLDTRFGNIRIQQNRGPGTHNGLKSITEHLGRDFIRIRMGIENRQNETISMDTSSYVLSSFNEEENAKLAQFIDLGESAARAILIDGISNAMNKYN